MNVWEKGVFMSLSFVFCILYYFSLCEFLFCLMNCCKKTKTNKHYFESKTQHIFKFNTCNKWKSYVSDQSVHARYLQHTNEQLYTTENKQAHMSATLYKKNHFPQRISTQKSEFPNPLHPLKYTQILANSHIFTWPELHLINENVKNYFIVN